MKAYSAKLLLLTVLLAVSMLLSLGIGSVNIPVGEVLAAIGNALQGNDSAVTSETIILDIRLPRIIFAALAGAMLSLVGLLMQTVSQNYLADPYILGVSSGASAGAVICLVSGLAQLFSPFGIYVGAFAGAAIATAFVIKLSGKSGSPIKLVLMGMGISALFSALTMFAIYGAKDEAQVRSAMFWLMGSLSGIQWPMVPIAAGALAFLAAFIYLMRHELDLLLLGKAEAESVGLSVAGLQRSIVIVSSLAIAILVSICGIIGFLGLIVPHIARAIGDVKHGVMLFFTSLLGGLTLVWADAMARGLFRPEELPIGILTSCLGAPVFIWIVKRKYGDF